MASRVIPVIDLFAGPGGLGEGFSQATSKGAKFDVRLSCEVDPVACDTLTLRKFFHLGRDQPSALKDYYRFVREEISLDQLRASQERLWAKAANRVARIELGNDSTRQQLHDLIRTSLKGEDFVLIGGPPCQAYSLVGRSRRLGIGRKRDEAGGKSLVQQRTREFFQDPKHYLYREYLEVIAVHRPAMFVMENVKGLLSAKTSADHDARKMSEQILSDLQNPFLALEGRLSKAIWPLSTAPKATRYRLVTLSGETEARPDLFGEIHNDPAAFLLRAEKYGVPQSRHRLIIVGIREDINRQPPPLRLQGQVSAHSVLKSLPPLRSSISRSDSSTEDWLRCLQEGFRTYFAKEPSISRGMRSTLTKVKNESCNLKVGGSWLPWKNTEKLPEELHQWLSDPELRGVLQHQARSHMPSDLARYFYCAWYAQEYGCTPAFSEWPVSLRPNHSNIRVLKGSLGATAFADRFKVQGTQALNGLSPPSSTITSHIAKDGHYYIHFDPTQVRSLTVREAARLQTFPDNYFFCGNRTQQYHQVGNAVPPYLAKQIANSLISLFAK